MVNTRRQAAEGPDPPSPDPPLPSRAKKRGKGTAKKKKEDANILPQPSPQPPQDLLGLLAQQQDAQQQFAQQLATLTQTLSMQSVPATITTGSEETPRPPTIPNVLPRASKHITAPKLAGPDGMTVISFRDWKQRWMDFANTQQLEQYPISSQHGILRSSLHSEWTILWNSARLKIQDDSSLSNVLKSMEAYIRKRRNPLLDRQEFHRRDQMAGESIDRYYAALKALDDACGHEDELHCQNCSTERVAYFGICPCGSQLELEKQLQDIRIRDRFICGLRDKEMQRRVLAEQFEAALTMEHVLAICTAVENSNAAGFSLGYPCSAELDLNAVSSTYRRQTKPQGPRRDQHYNSQARKCTWCGGGRHRRDQCPARSEKCKFCDKTGHFEAVCHQKHRQINYAQPDQPATEFLPEPHMTMRNVTIFKAGSCKNLIQIPTKVASDTHFIKWLPDTGADVDAISLKDVINLGNKVHAQLTTEKQEVFAANGTSLGPVGSLQATLTANNKVYATTIRVFENLTTPLLSKTGCIALGLIDGDWPHSKLQEQHQADNNNAITSGLTEVLTSAATTPGSEERKNTLLQELSSAFDDKILRPMKGPEMKIELIPGAKPCRKYKAYNIPFHWRDQVKLQLDDMTTKGIIEPVPVGEAIDWCHPMVVVPKKGTSEPRITVDLTGLNPYVRRPVYPTKIPREVMARIPPGNKYFTTLDARHGYWQVKLDEESKKLTTFITPWGCFRYCRNVMGLISAGDEHNRRGDEALVGIANVEKVVEDILIYDEDLETHTKRVREVINRCQHHGITLNAKKFVFAQAEVVWCGFKISAEGYTPAPHLVEAIIKFPVPLSKTDVRSFCGLVQQFEAFSSRISQLALPIRALLPKNAAFVWEQPHQQAFLDIIKELSSPRILAQFDPNRPVRLETDGAQSRGLGFALWQQQDDGRWKLLQAGSRFVTPTEARYSATEIEMLAVVWAVKKCRMFLLGKPFELVVDHRPLTSVINSKTLDEIDNPRLQRLKEKLACFRPQVVWRAGKQHIVVDVFSRFPSTQPEPEDQMETDTPFNFALTLRDVEDGTEILQDPILTSIQEAGAICNEYQRLERLIRNGFPNYKLKLDEDLRPYWKIQDELAIENGIILWGRRILIPTSLRRHVLETLHLSHQGQERTLRRARQAVFWPNIANDIKNVVRSCNECAMRLPSQQKEPMMLQAPPTRPFQCVGVDLFKYAGFEYLVMVDRFSGWLTVAKCGHCVTTSSVIYHLKCWMIDLGIPEKLMSDNGPQFASLEFKNWTRKWGILHDTSSPHYPQSNGLAESAVKAASFLLAKTSPNGDINNEQFQLGLLELRNTPRSDGRSPAQLLFGKPTRSHLPLHHSQFSPVWRSNHDEADKRATRLKTKAIKNYNSTAKPLPRLRCGEIVRIQDPRTKEWNRIAEVIDVHARGRSYTVRTESGRSYRRNRRFLRRFYPASSVDSSAAVPEGLRRSSRLRQPPLRFGYLIKHDQRSSSKGGHEVCSPELPRLGENRNRHHPNHHHEKLNAGGSREQLA